MEYFIKVVGLIVEYNPFHNGHLYHLENSKKNTKADYTIAIMSGSFTQSGNIAIYDKFTRAKLAIENGVDLVLELPTIYSNSSANYFAFGAINILDRLNIIDSICFGSECDNITLLENIAKTLLHFDDKINDEIKSINSNGMSYVKSRDKILRSFLTADELECIKSPNNILGIEYIKNIYLLNSKITPYLIKRKDSDFNDILLSKNTNFTSATSIRNCIRENKLDVIKKYVPASCFNVISSTSPLFNEKLFEILKYIIISSSKDKIKNIFEVNEGLENKILKEINTSNSYDEYVQNIKSKRYSLVKIKRMLNNIILNITKDDFNYAYTNKIGYAHILACSKRGKKLLPEISKNSDIELITSINNKILSSFKHDIVKYLNFDIFSSNIHSILTKSNINKDYTNKL